MKTPLLPLTATLAVLGVSLAHAEDTAKRPRFFHARFWCSAPNFNNAPHKAQPRDFFVVLFQ